MRARKRRARRPVPGWLVLLVVLMTAGATAWAMSQTAQGRGWTADPNTPYFPRQATNVLDPMAAGVQNGALPVAATRRVPPTIVAGVTPRHEDRGACTGCHAVVSPRGTPMMPISALAAMPHEVRGVCTNCHTLAVATPGAAGPAANWAAPPPPAPPGPANLTAPPAAQRVGGMRQADPAATCPTQF